MQLATPRCVRLIKGAECHPFKKCIFDDCLSVAQEWREMNKRSSSPRYKFSVYIARENRMSNLALLRLTKICEENVPGEYQIEVIDIAKRPDLARNYNIVATPAVFRTLPAPLRKSIGDLSDKDKAILGLDLLEPAKSPRTANRVRAASPQPAD